MKLRREAEHMRPPWVHSRRFDRAPPTSGLPPIPDILAARRHVSKVPKLGSRCIAPAIAFGEICRAKIAGDRRACRGIPGFGTRPDPLDWTVLLKLVPEWQLGRREPGGTGSEICRCLLNDRIGSKDFNRTTQQVPIYIARYRRSLCGHKDRRCGRHWCVRLRCHRWPWAQGRFLGDRMAPNTLTVVRASSGFLQSPMDLLPHRNPDGAAIGRKFHACLNPLERNRHTFSIAQLHAP
jgi:hypothetical protein